MAEERKQPELRFKGFTDDWIQCELGELVVQKKSYSLSRSVEVDEETGYKYIHYGDIHTNKVNLVSDDSILPNIGPGDYELLEKNDLILADASEDYEGIAWPSVIICTPLNKIVAGLHTIVLRPHRISSIFLYYHIHTLTFRKFGSKVGTGMKVFGITAKNLLKYKLYIPTFDEQIKIEKTLLLLDSIITLEQKKIEKLELLKQYLLQNMFANNDGNPKLRFDNFDEEWIQCELGEILDKRDEKIIPNADYPLMSFTSTGGIEEKGDRYDRSFLVKNSNKKYKATEFNDLIYSSNNLDVGAIGLNKFGNACISVVYEIFSITNNNPDVISYIVQTPRILHKIISYRQGALYGQYKIHSTDFLKVNILIPKIAEQEKISNFITNLDSIITLEQSKLMEYKDLKNKLLQSLFI
ncbi:MULTISPECIES: restriction endonuclease subunit S [Aerococcus]|nr:MULTISPECIES: restriction endonuclease subunit S [Aerococcus]MDK6689610.1 restriction endonuclease subunit S [Aerococcus urinae]MDL5208313.1 restriction endonuclease subunit S [Aerococcus tenax]WOZ53104.1 restriction endonuclease subunit S [Aerococcus tenax]